MKIVIAGGSGFLGRELTDFYAAAGHDVIVLTRGKQNLSQAVKYLHWDGKTIGDWINHLEGADMLINLAGKSVNCRYNENNKTEILLSRVDSVNVLYQAVKMQKKPVSLWIQSSSATIYRHAEDRMMDEANGELGSGFSVDVCNRWERAFERCDLPQTRKIILRTGIVLGKGGGAFPELVGLCKRGLGGPMGKGTQYISWLHIRDFVNIIEWLRVKKNAEGIYNCTAPHPLPNKVFMNFLRRTLDLSFHVTLPVWALTVGAFFLGTETELILKSRWVAPSRLLTEGFDYQYPNLHLALKDLLNKYAI